MVLSLLKVGFSVFSLTNRFIFVGNKCIGMVESLVGTPKVQNEMLKKIEKTTLIVNSNEISEFIHSIEKEIRGQRRDTNTITRGFNMDDL